MKAKAQPQVATLYVGVDIAKHDFAAATVWAEQTKYLGKAKNTEAGCEAFTSRIAERQQACGAAQVHLVVEPTGGLEAELVARAYRCGWLVTVVNLVVVRKWAQGQGQRAKTDRQDALILAKYGAEQQPEPQQELPEEIAELDSLLGRKLDLEKLLQSERNRYGRLNRHTAPAVRRSLEQVIAALQQELKTIEAAIKQLQHAQPTIKQQLAFLRSVPGIGEKIGPLLLVQLYRFRARTNGRGTAKQLVAYLGLDPVPYESGTSVRHRATISRQGNPLLRSKLFLGALGGVSGKNQLNLFYNSLLARSKPKKVALVACARKALTWSWAVFAHNTYFDPALAAKA
jgi:transposase